MAALIKSAIASIGLNSMIQIDTWVLNAIFFSHILLARFISGCLNYCPTIINVQNSPGFDKFINHDCWKDILDFTKNRWLLDFG